MEGERMIDQRPVRRFENEVDLPAVETEIARSAQLPRLREVLAERGAALLPRAARCHTELRSLPRRARRAWQRQLSRSSAVTAVLQEWSERRAGRALQKHLARSVAGAALLLALMQGVGHAATITVTTTNPAINGEDGTCSLIEAIVNANDNAATHPNCPAGTGADTIVLPKGTHAVSAVDNSTYGATGLPVIASVITIEGNGAKITRKGLAPLFRLMAVGPAGELTLKDVTLTRGTAAHDGGAIQNNGILAIQNSRISGNEAGKYGGGINNYGTLTIENSTISGNDAGYSGGGITSFGGPTSTLTIENSTISGNTVGGNSYGVGGGLAFYSGSATITNSTISGNKINVGSFSWGGGIFNNGTMTIDQSTISKNQARGENYSYGGGIVNGNFTIGGALTITNSIISGNKANGRLSRGGGIWTGATMTVQNSTVSHNDAGVYLGSGGGIANKSYYDPVTIEKSTISGNDAKGERGFGGGITSYGPLTIENSTISGNGARGKYGSGAGIANRAALTIKNGTISNNRAGSKFGYGGGIVMNGGTLTLERSLISGNKAGVGPEVDNSYGSTVTADDYNLFGANGASGVTGVTLGSTDIVPGPGVTVSGILGPLRDNGGPTETHALKAGSPAVNAIPSADPDCTGSDQRGISRPQGAGCDIGAFELQ
jgi:hypothetical protein